MTSKTLNAYYRQHKDRYQTLAKCTSVPEVVLKLEIYGKRWTHYDWTFLLVELILVAYEQHMNDIEDAFSLFDDVIDAIDNTDLLDNVISNKHIMLNLVNLKNVISVNQSIQDMIYQLLAHAFKKFPDMWNMSWMFTKRRYRKTVLRQHKLRNSIHGILICLDADEYYFSKQYYDDFMMLYFKSSTKQKGKQ